MLEENQPREYKVELELASGANLEMLMFSDTEHRWIFKHRYMHPENRKRLEDSILVNDTTLVVDYEGGVAQGCNLTMNIIRPDKRGKKYLGGVDISKGSHLFLEFVYEKQEDIYRMKTADLGAHERVDLGSLSEGLVKPIDFPLKDRVENKFGVYSIPFIGKDGKQALFEFPEDYRR